MDLQNLSRVFQGLEGISSRYGGGMLRVSCGDDYHFELKVGRISLIIGSPWPNHWGRIRTLDNSDASVVARAMGAELRGRTLFRLVSDSRTANKDTRFSFNYTGPDDAVVDYIKAYMTDDLVKEETI